MEQNWLVAAAGIGGSVTTLAITWLNSHLQRRSEREKWERQQVADLAKASREHKEKDHSRLVAICQRCYFHINCLSVHNDNLAVDVLNEDQRKHMEAASRCFARILLLRPDTGEAFAAQVRCFIRKGHLTPWLIEAVKQLAQTPIGAALPKGFFDGSFKSF